LLSFVRLPVSFLEITPALFSSSPSLLPSSEQVVSSAVIVDVFEAVLFALLTIQVNSIGSFRIISMNRILVC
jgi:hypothetical protein